jgi:predicted transcriptional regulator
MKSHISATIDNQILEDLNRFGREERRSRSQIIEMALEEFLQKRSGPDDEIVTSEERFSGQFTREETYPNLTGPKNSHPTVLSWRATRFVRWPVCMG